MKHFKVNNFESYKQYFCLTQKLNKRHQKEVFVVEVLFNKIQLCGGVGGQYFSRGKL